MGDPMPAWMPLRPDRRANSMPKRPQASRRFSMRATNGFLPARREATAGSMQTPERASSRRSNDLRSAMRRIETLLAFVLFALAAPLRADDFDMANQLYDQG